MKMRTAVTFPGPPRDFARTACRDRRNRLQALVVCQRFALSESELGLHFPYPGDTALTMTNYFLAAAARVQFGAVLQWGPAIALGKPYAIAWRYLVSASE